MNKKNKSLLLINFFLILGCSLNNSNKTIIKEIGNNRTYYEVYYKNICLSKYTLKDTYLIYDKIFYEGNNKIIIKDFKIDSVFIGDKLNYFMNGNLKSKERYELGVLNGWSEFYDSTTNKIIDKKYFSNGIKYFHKTYNVDNNCTSTNIKPKFEKLSQESTLLCKLTDSIKMNIYTDDSIIYDGFIVTIIQGDKMIYQVHPKDSEYLYIKYLFKHFKSYGKYRLVVSGLKPRNTSSCNKVKYLNDEIFIKIVR